MRKNVQAGYARQFVYAIPNYKTLASFCSWAGWSKSYLVAQFQRKVFSWCGTFVSKYFWLIFSKSEDTQAVLEVRFWRGRAPKSILRALNVWKVVKRAPEAYIFFIERALQNGLFSNFIS